MPLVIDYRSRSMSRPPIQSDSLIPSSQSSGRRSHASKTSRCLTAVNLANHASTAIATPERHGTADQANVQRTDFNRSSLLPFTLLGYVQLIYNCMLTTLLMYLLYLLLTTLYSDYCLKLSDLEQAAKTRRQACVNQYRENQCENPLPALLDSCRRWNACVQHSEEEVYRMPVLLELLASWLDVFLRHMSLRTSLALAAGLLALSLLTNVALTLARTKALFQNKGPY